MSATLIAILSVIATAPANSETAALGQLLDAAGASAVSGTPAVPSPGRAIALPGGRRPARATEAASCVERIVEFISLKENSQVSYLGDFNGSPCEINFRYSRYLNGISHRVTRDVLMSAFRQAAPGAGGFASATAFLSDSDVNEVFSINRCSMSGNILELDYSQRQRFGWHTRFDYKVRLTRDDAGIRDAQIREAHNGLADSVSCTVR